MKKAKISTEPNNRKNNNTSIISRDNKINLPEDKSVADHVKQRNIKLPGNTQVKLPSEEKTDESISITKQNQKYVLLKNKTVIKMQEESSGIDSDNNRKKNIVAIVPYDDKGLPVNKELQEKLNDNIVSPNEKYIDGIPVIPVSKDIFQALAVNPVSQIPKILTNNTEVGKDNKTVSKKQRNMKKGNSSLISATIFFSPDLVSTNLKEDDPHFREDDSHEIEKDEKFKFSSTIGVLIDYNNQ